MGMRSGCILAPSRRGGDSRVGAAWGHMGRFLRNLRLIVVIASTPVGVGWTRQPAYLHVRH
jgi:hypothetical protein